MRQVPARFEKFDGLKGQKTFLYRKNPGLPMPILRLSWVWSDLFHGTPLPARVAFANSLWAVFSAPQREMISFRSHVASI